MHVLPIEDDAVLVDEPHRRTAAVRAAEVQPRQVAGAVQVPPLLQRAEDQMEFSSGLGEVIAVPGALPRLPIAVTLLALGERFVR